MKGVAILLLVAGALVGASTAHARDTVKRPNLTWVRGEGSYTEASRTPESHTINTIVIHATDGGSLVGNVWWLSGGHSHASAHYVVARDGSIVQLVHLSDIAWHAGNWRVNCHSIGIEQYDQPESIGGFLADDFVLEDGMVMNFETLYFELGWGVLQLEDTYHVTSAGAERLQTMPQEPFLSS